MDHAEDLNTHLRKGFVELLGLRFTEATADRVAGTWEITPSLHQPYGIVHGGVHCSVIETLASMGAAIWLGDRGGVVGVSNQTDFLRAAREGTLTAVATPLHRGRLQQLWVVEIRDETDRLIARGQVRLQNVEAPDRLGGATPGAAETSPDSAESAGTAETPAS